MNPQLELRMPVDTDGMAVHQLIAQCPPLDTNSAYCNLLQCAHFGMTSVVAERGEELVGFISGYRIPSRPQTLFIWQVAVSASGRGQGLAGRMLDHILDRRGNTDISHMETTVTEDNEASWALFESLAKKRNATLKRTVMFDRERHFHGSHATEMLATIGPLQRPVLQAPQPDAAQ